QRDGEQRAHRERPARANVRAIHGAVQGREQKRVERDRRFGRRIRPQGMKAAEPTRAAERVATREAAHERTRHDRDRVSGDAKQEPEASLPEHLVGERGRSRTDEEDGDKEGSEPGGSQGPFRGYALASKVTS